MTVNGLEITIEWWLNFGQAPTSVYLEKKHKDNLTFFGKISAVYPLQYSAAVTLRRLTHTDVNEKKHGHSFLRFLLLMIK